MANTNADYGSQLRALSMEIYEQAKYWLFWSMVARIGVYIIGLLAIISSSLSVASPWIAALLAIVSELCLWWSDSRRSLAETLRRKSDMEDALGWEISSQEMSDVLARVPRKLRAKVEAASNRDTYFASSQEHGVVRALENLTESTWWSRFLAEKTAIIYLTLMIVLLVFSIAVLIVSIQTISNVSVLVVIGRVITSTIMLLFSLRLLRSFWGYYTFSMKTGRLEEQAERLLRDEEPNEIQAIKLMNEYHLARAVSPLIPTWIWRWHRDELNKLWQDHRASH
ncbi:MAG: hypothetical protein KDE46_01905 [Caldilineaceae bacterium]|nr:hypothetical protein [Caldilineaceae bacterium]